MCAGCFVPGVHHRAQDGIVQGADGPGRRPRLPDTQVKVHRLQKL